MEAESELQESVSTFLDPDVALQMAFTIHGQNAGGYSSGLCFRVRESWYHGGHWRLGILGTCSHSGR